MSDKPRARVTATYVFILDFRIKGFELLMEVWLVSSASRNPRPYVDHVDSEDSLLPMASVALLVMHLGQANTLALHMDLF
jgi:hypothetical protein